MKSTHARASWRRRRYLRRLRAEGVRFYPRESVPKGCQAVHIYVGFRSGPLEYIDIPVGPLPALTYWRSIPVR